MAKTRDPETRTESKSQLVEQINGFLRSGDYSRALDSLRGAAADFPNDAELSELEKRAQDGPKRKAEADRLITESQELFAQRKSAEAIELLRKAYELDKSNSLARSILANALVEHAQSLVESDWLKAETLTNQALALNPAHPTAKTILNQIVQKKEESPIEDWVSQATKLHTSGDLFAALAWVAEGLAVHPHDPKLLQVQDAIQRDQDARRRQARRGDLDDLRRLQHEIDKTKDVAAKQALAERIQAIAAKHWTDGEILSIANALLLRLGLVSKESSSPSPRSKGATVILHVPRPSAPKPSATDSPIPPKQVPATELPPSPPLPVAIPQSPVPASEIAPTQLSQSAVPPRPISASPVAPNPIEPTKIEPSPVEPTKIPPIAVASENVPDASLPPIINVAPGKIPGLRTPPRGKPRGNQAKHPAVTTSDEEPRAQPAKVTTRSSRQKRPGKSNSATLIIISVSTGAAILLVAAIFFFAQKHQAAPIAKTPEATPPVSAPADAAPIASAPAPMTTEPSPPVSQPSPDSSSGIAMPETQPSADSGHNSGTLVIVVGQDGARVALNGKLLRQPTQAGQLRLPNLPPRDYVVQVSKPGFQDLPQQKIRIRGGEETRLIFNLQPQPQPQPHMASLTIQGGAPGTTVLIDQAQVGTIQTDGTLSISNVNPGDHTVELRKDRFKPRQLKEHFTASNTISLAAADAALESLPGELKITFTPADAAVAIVKGDLLKTVKSGVPINLPAGTYTLTARTAERFTRWSTVEIAAGQSKTLDLSLAPSGMSKWEDPGDWRHEGDSYTRKGGNFVLYGAVPASGTFVLSAMLTKGHMLQWVVNYTGPNNYVLFQMDDSNFYRAVIRNGQRIDEIKIPHKSDKKSFRLLQIRVSPTEIVHEIKQGNSWTSLDHFSQAGVNLGSGKFGFYLPGDDQVSLSSFAHFADLNTH